MLLCHLIVLFVFVIFSVLLSFFSHDLSVELLSDEFLSFEISEDSLLLLLVVEHGIELLDGGPLIILINFGEDLSLRLLGRGIRFSISSSRLASRAL